MKKILLLLIIGWVVGSVGYAQETYTISGKILGLTSSKVYLIAADFGRNDTLESASVEKGKFVLKGNLQDGVCAANIVFDNLEGQLPMLVENIDYQITVTAQGATVEGEGPAAKLYKEFVRLAQTYAAEQQRIEVEYKSANDNVKNDKVSVLQIQLDSVYREYVNKTNNLIKNNPDSYVSAYVIALGITVDDEVTLRTKYSLLSPQARFTVPGQAVAAALERYSKLTIGEIAPEFTLTKSDGNKFSLHGLKTKWKLLTFWASFDSASRQENLDLVRLYLQFRPKGLEIISVSLDDSHAAWKNAIGLDGMIWTNVSDLRGYDSDVVRLYQIGNLPCNFLLDADNRIVAKDLHGAELIQKLTELTKRKKR